jgi:hypothetical protein
MVNIPDIDKRIRQINEELNLDGRHTAKRILAFSILDQLIDNCLSNTNCPTSADLEAYEYFLADISIAQYIRQKAYIYSTQKIGVDDDSRYYKALNRVNKVLDCEGPCNMPCGFFKESITKVIDNPMTYSSMKKRKAYWNYLTFYPNNNSITDYQGACSVIESIYCKCDDSVNLTGFSRISRRKINEFCSRNQFTINGFELFLICHTKHHHSESAQAV